MKIATIQSRKDQTTALALDTLKKKKQALVFCNTKRGAESQAEKIAKEIKSQQDADKQLLLEQLSKKIRTTLSSPTKQCKRLADCVLKGIAFHHAGLASKQRELVEDAFGEGVITIICSTPTLAAGLDLPAFRTIIRDLKRFGNRGMAPIPVLEYEQMAGRAGRPGKETYGEAIIVAKTEQEIEDMFTFYVHGEVEEIFSKLAVKPALRMYTLSLVATAFTPNTQSLFDFFSKTFYAQQFSDSKRLQRMLQELISQLQTWEFIAQDDNSLPDNTQQENNLFMPASKLLAKEQQAKQEQLTATALGHRISELYIDPLTAHILLRGLQKLSAQEILLTDKKQTFAFVHLLTCALEMSPLFRTKAVDAECVETRRLQQEFLFSEDEYYELSAYDFDDTITTTHALLDWMSEHIEDELFTRYGVRPGELNSKLQRADWLLYGCEELARIKKYTNVIRFIKHIRLRLKHGVKSELMPLLQFKHVGRVRARKLFSHNITTIGEVSKATPEFLAGIIGAQTAANLKQQVGQDISAKEEERQEHL